MTRGYLRKRNPRRHGRAEGRGSSWPKQDSRQVLPRQTLEKEVRCTSVRGASLRSSLRIPTSSARVAGRLAERRRVAPDPNAPVAMSGRRRALVASSSPGRTAVAHAVSINASSGGNEQLGVERTTEYSC